ncbi:hypothetical protein HF086_017155 [Spodoptera exigua]|uniref:Uncharacterized protein n=1 Tax=Spodoptera exigua TaxID=7107 RepID=A0A922SGY4_SPOEX|nr:hypothetical protein HF086_017155 [Spodoptera exigua]
MTIGDENVYENFDYSLNVQKIMNIRDSDLENLMKSYNVTQKSLDEMVASIREWYEKQPHLPQGQLREYLLIDTSYL